MRLSTSGASRRLLLAALLSASTYGCGIALMGSSAWLISRAAEHPAASALVLVAVVVRALALTRGLARYAERLVGHDATLRTVADLRVAVYRSLVAAPRSSRTAEALSVVVTDVEAVQDLWLRCAIPFAAALLVSVTTVLACLSWSTPAGLVLLAGLASSLVLVPVLSAVFARKELELAEHRATYQAQVLDVLQGCADLTVLGELPRALAKTSRAAEALAQVDRRASVRTGVLSCVTSLIQAVTVLGVIMVAVLAVHDGRLPRVGLAVVVLVAFAAFEPIAPLVDAGALLPRTWGAVRRLSSLVEAPDGPPGASETGGAIHLLGVTASYGEGLPPALHDIDLDLRRGQCVAVVGPSGAGKSTLLRVLTGALAPDSGEALLGTTSLRSLNDEQLSRHVVLAEQQAYLFNATLRDNLRIGRPSATDTELLEVLEVVALDQWFSLLPRGWDTELGEHGALVSGGERTRIGVARALLSEAPLLLLDEPTEGLDPVAADDLLRRLISEKRERAVLIVTHRIGGLGGVDAVLTMREGRLLPSRSTGPSPRESQPCSPALPAAVVSA